MALFAGLAYAILDSMVKLLIVESHNLVREALAKRLGTAVGLEIATSTGRHADILQKAQTFTPDVILLETKTPEGLKILRTLRQALPKSAVIVLTSYPDSREEDEVREIGATSYLLKTLDTKSLVHEIRTVARHINTAQKATAVSR